VLQTLSEDNKCDCDHVASIGSAQPTLSTDDCPTVDSSPQYVIDTETGIKHLPRRPLFVCSFCYVSYLFAYLQDVPAVLTLFSHVYATLNFCPVCGRRTPSLFFQPLYIHLPIFYSFLLFPYFFSCSLYFFFLSSIPSPFYQSSPTPFPGLRS